MKMTVSYMALWIVLCLGMLLSACSTNTSKLPDVPRAKISSQTVGDTFFAPITLDNRLLLKPSLQQLRDDYAALLPKVTDLETKKVVQYRLADLSAIIAEQHLETGQISNANGENTLRSAVKQYKDLLISQPKQDENMEVMYQLAKAYEQQGAIDQSYTALRALLRDFPHNPYVAEVYFRLGEIEFSRKEYAAAINAYKQVVALGAQSTYYPISTYMLGWSYSKNKQDSQALDAFTLLLDYSLPSDIIAKPMLTQFDSQAQIDSLPQGEKRLVTDTLRIMALLFSYEENQIEDNTSIIEQYFKRVGQRHYEYVLYDQLAQLYLNQGRFKDSARIYKRFTQLNPQHFQAPIWAVKEIDVYILGEFSSLVLPAKRSYIEHYGIQGEFWPTWGLLQQERVSPYLKQYLQELSAYEHNRAQQLTANQQSGDKEAYLLAAKWYREFIDTFPTDMKIPQLSFSLGEALFSAESYGQAIETFEAYAYSETPQEKSAEAAYAAILAYRKIQTQGTQDSPLSREQWFEKQLISQENFVAKYAHDSRAANVLYILMQQLFSLERYATAINKAQQLLAWNPEVSAQDRSASLFVIAHSQFALEDYSAAETSYQNIDLSLAADAPHKVEVKERLAASIYRQGERKIKQKEISLAVNDFLRVIAVAPDTSIRITAQYDAISYLLELEQWQPAIELLENFKFMFHDHALATGIDDKLIFAYEQNENWQLAADMLVELWRAKSNTEEGRQALYVAAQYYYKVDETLAALKAYRDYAHSYPLPLAEAMEAQYILSEIYRQSNDEYKRYYWLRKLIEADELAMVDPSIKRSDRSRYLAAMGAFVLAEDALQSFNQITLTLPLKESLARKKQAQELALQGFNQVLNYNLAEFNSAANFYMGDVYHQLAKDLLNASKPSNLSELELEQYELLLEEQAFPFEELAIKIHEKNIQRLWQGDFDKWVQQSLDALKTLMPARYQKAAREKELTNEIF